SASPTEARRDTRRSKRVYISMPVIVKGVKGNQPFEEQAITDAVNAQGCLVRLAHALDRGQKLTLTNAKTTEEIECRVVYLGQSDGGKTQAGLEFTRGAAYFWRIAFPPDDWDPADRKKPATGQPSPRKRP
ncbi:MAG: PilZ domain-containing protein, partial [Candidatus Acidiferrales bacterium]